MIIVNDWKQVGLGCSRINVNHFSQRIIFISRKNKEFEWLLIINLRGINTTDYLVCQVDNLKQIISRSSLFFNVKTRNLREDVNRDVNRNLPRKTIWNKNVTIREVLLFGRKLCCNKMNLQGKILKEEPILNHLTSPNWRTKREPNTLQFEISKATYNEMKYKGGSSICRQDPTEHFQK